MPLKPILFLAGAVACGIAAYVGYAQEGTRLAVRDHNKSVQGSVLRSWTTKSRRGSEQHWVEYLYKVDGTAYKGEERHVYGSLPLGGPIRVWYDPASPDRCVSDPELRYGRDLKFTFIAGTLGVFALVAAGKSMFKARVTA